MERKGNVLILEPGYISAERRSHELSKLESASATAAASALPASRSGPAHSTGATPLPHPQRGPVCPRRALVLLGLVGRQDGLIPGLNRSGLRSLGWKVP